MIYWLDNQDFSYLNLIKINVKNIIFNNDIFLIDIVKLLRNY